MYEMGVFGSRWDDGQVEIGTCYCYNVVVEHVQFLGADDVGHHGDFAHVVMAHWQLVD